jgi:cathepsin L
MKAGVAVLATLVAAEPQVNGGSVSITWSDCGDATTHGKISGLDKDTIVLGEATTVTGSGVVDEDITGGDFAIVAKAGLITQKYAGQVCEAKVFDLPLGLGQITWNGLSCPAAAGDISVGVGVKLASAIPSSMAKADIQVSATGSSTDDKLLCMSLHTEASASGFDAYLNKFGKAYNGNDEYATRKAIYEENMKFIEAENAKGHSYTLGETPFTDLTNDEFKAKYVSGYKPASEMLGDLPYLGEHEVTASTGAVDWTTKGAVTPVKNQGQCGSCWSFSTTGGLEGAWQISTGQLTSMSEQQFVDCDTSSMGCNGGSMATAFSWAKSQAIATEASYPYTAVDGTCKTSGLSTAIPAGGVTGYKSVGSLFFKATVASLESAIDLGPVSIAIEADQSSFQHYTGGVLDSGCGTSLDHGVLAVGYDSSAGYWKVKNSWGSSWGDNGYIKLAQAGNVCGILNQPVYPTVSGSVSV